MRIDLIAGGVKAPSWVVEGFTTYQKRLSGAFSLHLTEIPLARRGKTGSEVAYRREEWQRMSKHLTADTHNVALDVKGKQWSTEQFAERLAGWQADVGRVNLFIGGPDGLDPDCLASAQDLWSLSKLTFPHFIVRVLVAEQVYRGVSLLGNHPYHRAN